MSASSASRFFFSVRWNAISSKHRSNRDIQPNQTNGTATTNGKSAQGREHLPSGR